MKLIYLTYRLLLTGALIFTGCFPDRQPFAPEELETRRPKVAFIVPGDEMVALPATNITTWFDEIMDLETVRSGFVLSLAEERLPWEQIQNIGCIARNPLNPAQMILGRSDRGAFTSQTGSGAWQFHFPLAYFKILNFYFDPQQSGRIYARLDSGLLKTEDNGATWAAINSFPAKGAFSCLAINPQNTAEVWLGTDQGLFRSDNSGISWQPGRVLPQWAGQIISQIAFDPMNNSNIWVATLGRYVYKSTDGGTTWEMQRGVTNRLPASRLYDVVVTDGQIFVATINAGIYKSSDGGENWFPVNSGITDLNTRRIFLNSVSPNRLFVATANRLFVTENAGENWSLVSLPNSGATIVDLFLDQGSPFRLLLATNSSVYFSQDGGNTWSERNEIDAASLRVNGTMQFANWRGQLEFLSVEGDTLVIAPHREDDALAAYDAGVISDPPVDANPQATQMIFTPNTPLLVDWFYQIKIAGAFSASVWQAGIGAKDLHGNSLEFDQLQYFEVKTE